ncbi:MAG: O-6-methylguanine methyltransferase [Candidatus Kaiserbacteria bacterium]|nr:O-6-methylguanine methyltransferase [Candidatus Kaiserbacteria bacterium]
MMKSPIGNLTLVGSDRGLAAILWEKEKKGRVPLKIVGEDKKLPILIKAEKQLNEYFAKKRKTFDLTLDFNGTDFQKKVWKALLNIPFGATVSYGDIARKVGKPTASRAVGAANGKNPISIIAACHRVIGTSGKLTGYAGGVENKVMLLELEGGTFEGKASKNSRLVKQ